MPSGRDLPAIDRWALPELFLTTVRTLTENEYLAGARIPADHPYYTDRLPEMGPTGGIDPLLLLECCRQAGPYAGRELLELQPDGRFLLESCTLALPGILTAGRTEGPAELALAVTAQSRPGAGTARRVSYTCDMTVPAGRLGAAELRVRHLPRELYDTLRPPRTRRAKVSLGAPIEAGTPVAPHLVGRTRPDNVVLTQVALRQGRAHARLRVPLGNPALFDPSYDHVPAMALLEAARQLSLFTAAETWGALPRHTTVAGYDFAFHRFVEPHTPVTVRLSAYDSAEQGDPPGTRLPQLRSFRVMFEQNGTVAAEGRTHLTTVASPALVPGGDPS
ncbi:AfsA-related hotdog domain-containing protein [Streptomyces sp. NPDC093589]|uniref:AfsA-related hotdog domain-containing protein n=1 Tax=Streptomyces sp. NPDC093589 TaxID=3366043 RepID=UPI003826990A